MTIQQLSIAPFHARLTNLKQNYLNQTALQRTSAAAQPMRCDEVTFSGHKRKTTTRNTALKALTLDWIRSSSTNQAGHELGMSFDEIAKALKAHFKQRARGFVKLKPIDINSFEDSINQGNLCTVFQEMASVDGGRWFTLGELGSAGEEGSKRSTKVLRKVVGAQDIPDLETTLFENLFHKDQVARTVEHAIGQRDVGHRIGDVLPSSYPITRQGAVDTIPRGTAAKGYRQLADKGLLQLQSVPTDSRSGTGSKYVVVSRTPQTPAPELARPYKPVISLLHHMLAHDEFSPGNTVTPSRTLSQLLGFKQEGLNNAKRQLVEQGWLSASENRADGFKVVRTPQSDELADFIRELRPLNHVLTESFIGSRQNAERSGVAWTGLSNLATALNFPSKVSKDPGRKQSAAKFVADILEKETLIPVLEKTKLRGNSYTYRLNPYINYYGLNRRLDMLNKDPQVLIEAAQFRIPIYRLPVLFETQMKGKPFLKLEKEGSRYYLQTGFHPNGGTPTTLDSLPQATSTEERLNKNQRVYTQRALTVLKDIYPIAKLDRLSAQPRIQISRQDLDVVRSLVPALTTMGFEFTGGPDSGEYPVS